MDGKEKGKQQDARAGNTKFFSLFITHPAILIRLFGILLKLIGLRNIRLGYSHFDRRLFGKTSTGMAITVKAAALACTTADKTRSYYHQVLGNKNLT
jgi:hypothetical protein